MLTSAVFFIAASRSLWKSSRLGIFSRAAVSISWISVFWESVRLSFLATSGSLKAMAPRTW